MNTRLATIAISTALGVGVLLAILAPAQAEPGIGSTAVVHNDVTKDLGATSGILGAGEDVYRDEAVKTGAESSTKLIFLDSTNLSVGPLSRLVLDRFVFNSDRSSQTMAVDLAKGVFRFTTGVLDKQAYSISTPTASIGVRGTILDVAVDGGRTRVTLVEGSAIVCPRGKAPASGDCVDLQQPGQTALVTLAGASFTSDSVDFASLCLSDIGLCGGYASYSAGGTFGQLGLTNTELGITALNFTGANEPVLYFNGTVGGDTGGGLGGTDNGQVAGFGDNPLFGGLGPPGLGDQLILPPPTIIPPPTTIPPPPVTAVPEVSTWGMMLLGLVGLGFMGRRRTKRRASALAVAGSPSLEAAS